MLWFIVGFIAGFIVNVYFMMQILDKLYPDVYQEFVNGKASEKARALANKNDEN